ncbi:MAG TPA: ABC transporter permease, partial [Ramlibacter sp.]
MLPLLATYSWQEVRHHAWRSATAVLAVMLGVALAFSVHLINASALDEFSSAARSAGGQPDLELRAAQGAMDEALYGRIGSDPRVATASPVLELQTLAVTRDGRRSTVRVLGVDALVVAAVAPQLMPAPSEGMDRLAVLSPDTVFLNPAAQRLLPPQRLRVQAGLALREVRVAGTTNAGGGPLLVMDIAAAQDLFGRGGQLTRIDVRLQPGVSQAAWLRELQLPPGVQAAEPGDAGQRVSQLSRAYRVNLTVLALVALFTGAFLVFSVLALSVARRAQQFAL